MSEKLLSVFANALDSLVRDFIGLGLTPDEMARLLELRATILRQDGK